MKRTPLLLLLICIVFISIPVIADTDNVNVILNSSKTLDNNNCYICGVFYEDVPSYLLLKPFVHMKITNLDTNEKYDISFYRKRQSSFYQLNPGRYKISSIDLHFLRVASFSTSTDIVTLKVEAELLKEFQLSAGESIYIGDYIANFARKSTFSNIQDTRTAYISLLNNSDKMEQDFLKNNANSQLAFHFLDIKEVIPSAKVIDIAVLKKEKSMITCKLFINEDSAGKYQLKLFNLTTKKGYSLDFKKSNELQYLEVTPGEYYIETIYYSGSFRYKGGPYDFLIPKELLLPFEIESNQALYLGSIGINDKGGRVGSLYINDFETKESQLKDDLESKNYTVVKFDNFEQHDINSTK